MEAVKRAEEAYAENPDMTNAIRTWIDYAVPPAEGEMADVDGEVRTAFRLFVDSLRAAAPNDDARKAIKMPSEDVIGGVAVHVRRTALMKLRYLLGK